MKILLPGFSLITALFALLAGMTARADITHTPSPTGSVVIEDLDKAAYEIPVCASDGTGDTEGSLGTCITLPVGPTGPTGPIGPTGPTGPAGPGGFLNQVRVYAAKVPVVADTEQFSNAECEDPQIVSGGGFRIDAEDASDYARIHIISSVAGLHDIWLVDFTSTGPLADAVTVQAHAVCTDPAP